MLFNELVHTLTLHLQKFISSFIKNISNKTMRSIYFCDKHNKISMMNSNDNFLTQPTAQQQVLNEEKNEAQTTLASLSEKLQR